VTKRNETRREENATRASKESNEVQTNVPSLPPSPPLNAQDRLPPNRQLHLKLQKPIHVVYLAEVIPELAGLEDVPRLVPVRVEFVEVAIQDGSRIGRPGSNPEEVSEELGERDVARDGSGSDDVDFPAGEEEDLSGKGCDGDGGRGG